METEQVDYEVPGGQMRWRVAQLKAQGLPYDVQRAGNIYIFSVQQPPDIDPFTYQPQRTHSIYRAFDRDWLLRWGLVFALVAMFFGVGFLVVRQAGSIDLDAAWKQVESIRLPWDDGPEGEPVVETTEFRWPWESKVINAPASLQAEKQQWPWDTAAKSAQDTVTLAAGAVLAVLVLLIVLSLVRKRR